MDWQGWLSRNLQLDVDLPIPLSRLAYATTQAPSSNCSSDDIELFDWRWWGIVDFAHISHPNNIADWKSQAIALTNLLVSTDPDGQNSAGPSIRIQGTRGEIQLDGPSFRPERHRIILRNDNTQVEGSGSVREVNHPISPDIKGTYWETDEVGRCLQDGKIESELLPWDEMTAVMNVMDEAWRQGGLSYPDDIESTIYSSSYF